MSRKPSRFISGAQQTYGQRTQLRTDYARNAKNRGITRGGFRSRFSTTQTRYYQKFNVNNPLGNLGRGNTSVGRGSVNTGVTTGIRNVKSFLSSPVGSKSIGGTLASSIRSLKGTAGSYAADVRSVNTGAVKNFLEVKNAIPGFIRGAISKRVGRAFERNKALTRLDRTLSKVGGRIGKKLYRAELKVTRAIGRTAPAQFIGRKLKRLDRKLLNIETKSFGEGRKKLRILKTERGKVQGVRALRDTRLERRKTTKEARRSNTDYQKKLRSYTGERLGRVGRGQVEKLNGLRPIDANTKVYNEERKARIKAEDKNKKEKIKTVRTARELELNTRPGAGSKKVKLGSAERNRQAIVLRNRRETLSNIKTKREDRERKQGLSPGTIGGKERNSLAFQIRFDRLQQQEEKAKNKPVATTQPVSPRKNIPQSSKRGSGRSSGLSPAAGKIAKINKIRSEREKNKGLAPGTIGSKSRKEEAAGLRSIRKADKAKKETVNVPRSSRRSPSKNANTKINDAVKSGNATIKKNNAAATAGAAPTGTKPAKGGAGKAGTAGGTKTTPKKGTKTQQGTTSRQGKRGYAGQGTKSKYFFKDKKRFLTETGAAAPIRKGQKGRPVGSGKKGGLGKKGKGGGKGRL